MAQFLINLKKQGKPDERQTPNAESRTRHERPVYPPPKPSIPKFAPPPKPEVASSASKSPLLEWSALEYAVRERGPYWFLPPSGVALAFVLFGILIQSWFFIAFVVLALVVVLLYAKRPPREYRFAITPEGVGVGPNLHRFKDLRSFWIFDMTERNELSLETGRLLHPYLHLPLPPDPHPNRIRNILSQYLPEKEHTDLFTDQISRSIGF